MSSAGGETRTAGGAGGGGGSASYWCSRCCRLSRVITRGALVCPECDPGFVEGAETPPQISSSSGPADSPQTCSTARPAPGSAGRADFYRRSLALQSGHRPPRPSETGNDGGVADGAAGAFELYYDEGAGAGLRPLPASVSDFLMGAGFDRLLDQLNADRHHGLGGVVRSTGRSKAAVDRCRRSRSRKATLIWIPTARLQGTLRDGDGSPRDALQAYIPPWMHLPWLSLRNSCPVVATKCPRMSRLEGSTGAVDGGEEDGLGLTIWRFPAAASPSAGFPAAEGRRKGASSGLHRDGWRIQRERRRPQEDILDLQKQSHQQSGRVRRALGRFFSFFGRLRWSSSARTSHGWTFEEVR
ncbi:unnamed protein product [Spirodela intermedia]|uniref:Uncharacterized protein n=1 Tax=Spirodela intermedia TaxID=51605 RepID=A0A7I8IFZ9_SPIIN|nr:unnamed protein product [Spirodela intermedia]CAA6656799.1 unnamed protein product [Spirodela intermedia]